MNRALLMAGMLALLGCEKPEPMVSDFNGDSVKVAQDITIFPANAQDPEVIKQANETCAHRDRKAKYASTITDNRNNIAQHLFLCL